MVTVAGGTGLKLDCSIVCSVCGKMSEAILSHWKPSQAHGCRLIWSEKKTIPCGFPWSHFTSTYNLFRGKKKKATAAHPFVPPPSIRSILERKQTGTKRQQGPRQENKAADLIRLLCLSFTKWVLSCILWNRRELLSRRQESHWSCVAKKRDSVTPHRGHTGSGTV